MPNPVLFWKSPGPLGIILCSPKVSQNHQMTLGISRSTELEKRSITIALGPCTNVLITDPTDQEASMKHLDLLSTDLEAQKQMQKRVNDAL